MDEQMIEKQGDTLLRLELKTREQTTKDMKIDITEIKRTMIQREGVIQYPSDKHGVICVTPHPAPKATGLYVFASIQPDYFV